MQRKRRIFKTAVRRDGAERYILISLIAFAMTIIITRAFLQLTGFPQIGNSVLHIAHALWGGLLLIVAVYLPLAYANRWALRASALLSGVGIGLFIDEVGKFITQANDYFFPPALPLIYGVILVNVLVYLYFRRIPEAHPRQALSQVLEGLQEMLDGNLDVENAARLEEKLTLAMQSEQEELRALADGLQRTMQTAKATLTASEGSGWQKMAWRLDRYGRRLGRSSHRVLINIVLGGWILFIAGYVAVLWRGSPQLDPQILQWRGILLAIQIGVGILLILAAVHWWRNNENLGLQLAVGGFLLSLVAMQLLYFYLSQFAAITMTLLQFVILQLLFAYRRWYLPV